MLRRLGIRSKVLAVLAVPMIVLLVAGAYISRDALADAKLARAIEGVVKTLDNYAPIGQALQQERALSLTPGVDPAELEAARKATDQAVAALRPITAKLDLSVFPEDIVTRFHEAQEVHNNLDTMRRMVDTQAQDTIIKRNYDAVIQGQIALVRSTADTIGNRELAQYVAAYAEISNTGENLVQEMAQGVGIIMTQGASPAAVRALSTQIAKTELARTTAGSAVSGLGVDNLRLPLKDPTSDFTRKRQLLETGSKDAIATVAPDAWMGDIQSQLVSLVEVRDDVLTNAENVAESAAEDAQTQATLTISVVVLAVVASLLFALVVSRGIVVPLRRLTSAAGEVRTQLPTLVEQVAVPGEGPGVQLVQIPVDSKDEVGQLAAAFNSVNAMTLQVAQEQAALRGSIAEMFINVARRDQVLLNRQLSFIDSLERAEEDPNTLANLFRLDHLATRMRRNAESLLVLAGIDSGRRMRDSMPLSDVIRTASSEIEQYDRIQLSLPVDPQMHGYNALGAAHLLAELLENATVFSEPETPVEVSTGIAGEFVHVTIVDHGLGMSEAELVAANEKIRSVSAGDVLGAQRLGLFVVGRLANRLGAEVYLTSVAHGTGTQTLVRLPITLFEATGQPALGAPPVVAASTDVVVPQLEALPAEEAPVVEAVDLAALTDGATPLGLPKRRLRDGAPAPEPVTVVEEERNFVLPAPAEAKLSPELSASATGWAPAITAAGGGLPSRSRAATAAWQRDEDEPVTAATPTSPVERTSLFSGFRTRQAEISPEAGGPVAPVEQEAVVEIPQLAPEEPVAPFGAAAPADEPVQHEVAEAPAYAPSEDAFPQPEAYAPAEPEPAAQLETAPYEPAHEPAQYETAQYETAQYETAQYEAVQPEAPAPVAEALPTRGRFAAEPVADAPRHAAPEVVPAEAAAPAFVIPGLVPDDEPYGYAAEQPQEEAPASHPGFTAYSGYSGYSPQTASQPAVGFGHMLDESRAWNAGEEPVALHAPAPHPEYDVPTAYTPPPAPAPAEAYSAPVGYVAPPPAVEETQSAPRTVSSDGAARFFRGASHPAPVAPPAWSAPAPADAAPAPAPVDAAPAPSFPPAPSLPAPSALPVQQSFAPAEPAAPVAQPAPPVATPAWSAPATAEPAFADIVQGAAKPQKRKWWSFGRRKDEAVAPADVAPSTAPDPVRASAWSSTSAPAHAAPAAPVSAPLPAVAPQSPAQAWGAPAAPAVPAVPASAASPRWATEQPSTGSAWQAPEVSVPAPHPAPAVPASGASYAPAASAWSTSPDRPATAAAGVPSPSSPIVVPLGGASRLGALDDEVAAMLALRADIQEQALSELSQLSAYRPSVVDGTAAASPSLVRRVPTAVPAAPPIAAPEGDRPSERDADQLRSRLSSFQSGTSRGRRAAGDPADASATTQDSTTGRPAVATDTTPGSPTW